MESKEKIDIINEEKIDIIDKITNKENKYFMERKIKLEIETKHWIQIMEDQRLMI